MMVSAMCDPMPFTEQRVTELASSAVHKIDLLGDRGCDRVTTEEIYAMACLLILSGLLPDFQDRKILPRNTTGATK